MKAQSLSLSPTDKLNLISNFSTMINAGIPILSAITSLSEEAKKEVKFILEITHKDLLQGKHLYESFAKFPRIFDEVTINIIRASEQSGTLDVALKDLREQIKRDIAFNRKIRSALTYPALVVLVFIAVLLLILIVVMPKIATVFTQLKVKLPLPTKILIFSSNFLLHQTLFAVGGLVLLVLVGAVIYRLQKQRVLTFFYSLPGISNLIRDMDLMRVTRNLHLLLNAGVNITSALDLTEQVVLKKEIAHAIAHAKQSILAGKPLSYSMKLQRKIFPSTMIELVQAGEKTGTLDKSMQDTYEYFDYKVTDTLSVLTALLEPVMLVLVALLVGSMMVAIIGPIYGLIGQIGPH